jgi:hypothetical protein
VRARGGFKLSVESLVITAVVKEGPSALQKVYHAGVNREDFVTYEEEWDWVEYQYSQRKNVNTRTFKRRFPDFEWLPPSDETLQELLADLKSERAYIDTRSLIESIGNDLRVDNAVDMALHARDALAQITRLHSPVSDANLTADWQDHYDGEKLLRSLHQSGQAPGLPTGFRWLDFHWDGLVRGRMIVVLGRPGDGKSYLIMYWVWHAIKNNYKVLFFSPEMSKHEHTCRLHTLASADPDVKAAIGLKHSFRNRALMNGQGFNLKSYRAFMEYLADSCGSVLMPTGINRRIKMTPSFIEAKIQDMQPDLVVVDPIYKIKAPINRRTSFEELSDVSDMIQDLAESYNIPIVVSNQAHRQMSRKEDAPHKDNSFNSDVPIQEADHVVGVKHLSEEHRMIVRCSKSRFGEDFRFEVAFWPNTGMMKELSEPQGDYYNDDDDDADEEELKQIIAAATGRETENVS